MKTILYINLSNGIEFLSHIPSDLPARFIRIQSTWCEQKRWEDILLHLDNDLLFNLAIGNQCIIADTSIHTISRALWQGVPWIEYALNKAWFNKEIKAFVRSHNVSKYFEGIYQKLDKRTIKKLTYFKKFSFCNRIDLHTIYMLSRKDSKYKELKEIIKRYKEGCNYERNNSNT